MSNPFTNNECMMVETVQSLLTLICHFKKTLHWVRTYIQDRLAYTMTIFILLLSWDGFKPMNLVSSSYLSPRLAYGLANKHHWLNK